MKVPITPLGVAKLRDELKALKSSRPELSRAIEVARAHGDISENADYDAAKEKSGMTEARIRDIEGKLSNTEVIDPLKLKEPSRVVFGTTVEVTDLDSGEARRLTLVGPVESDVDRGWISVDSPLGRGLISKEVGDTVTLILPGGKREYVVEAICVDYEQFKEPSSDRNE